MTLADWQRHGLVRPGGRPFPRPDDTASLFLPAGARGPAFLLLKNFSVIRRYNNAASYALAVGHLSDRVIGGGPFAAPWPRGERPLNADGIADLQAALTRAGFDSGPPDGKMGPKTRAAVRAFQRSIGMEPDGFTTDALLRRLLQG